MTKFDQRYAGEAFFYGTDPNTFLAEVAQLIPAGGRVLSLGEGEGRNAVYLAERGYRVHALDESRVGLEKAERLAASRGVAISTECLDLANYHLEPQRWDAILSIWCHLPSALRKRLHGEIPGALRPEGVYILEAYTPAQIGRGTGGPKDADLTPTKSELLQDLSRLDCLIARECEREVQEGTGHSGLSAVVQFVARRAEGAR